MKESTTTRNPTGGLFVDYDQTEALFCKVGDILTATIVALNGDNKPVADVSISAKSHPQNFLTEAKIDDTNAYGQTKATITCVKMPDETLAVIVTITGTIREVEHQEVVQIIVDP